MMTRPAGLRVRRMHMMELTAKLLLGAAALVSLWFMVKGLIDMQRVNTTDAQVLEVEGLVRRVSPHGRYDTMAVLTISVEDTVAHVDCLLPGPWFGRRQHHVTDLVRVLWRRGEPRAVAVQTIRDGQRMFIIGIIALTVTAVLFITMF